MYFYDSLGTNETRSNDLATATKEMRFLTISETACILGSGPTVSSRFGFETGGEVLRDLRDHLNVSYALLGRDDI
jgi:hypothetical protein